MNRTIVLRALDGSNPLAFMAALGTLRLLHSPGGCGVRMRWRRAEHWNPELIGFNGSEDEVCEALMNSPRVPVENFAVLGKNITVNSTVFTEFIAGATNASPTDRRYADFAAAFGNESCEDKDKDRIEYTNFCFITGSGHQHFLGTMEELVAKVTVEHLRHALFLGWRRQRGLSMRWDPQDAAEYALQWSEPGQDGASAVWGANRLALEALPLFPTQPTNRGLRTTGFRSPRQRGGWPQFTWPIWTEWAGLDTVRSLLSLKELLASNKDFTRAGLQERGIAEVYRAQRVRIGQGANFKVSFRPSVAI